MRWYGLNFQGTDDTEDGTGLDPAKINSFFTNGAQTLRPKTLTIGLCMYNGIDPKVYKPICEMIRQYGHRIMLRVIDSQDMKDYTIKSYGQRYQETLNILSPLVDYVECANEISGSRGDKKWPGPDAYDKMKTALKVCLNSNKVRVVTLFWNNDDPGYVWEWTNANPFSAEVILMSDYPRATPDAIPQGLNGIINQMNQRFSNSFVGIGEYGLENSDGVDDATPAERAAMIAEFEARKHTNQSDVGGGFYWDAYEHLVAKPDQTVLAAFKDAWS